MLVRLAVVLGVVLLATLVGRWWRDRGGRVRTVRDRDARPAVDPRTLHELGLPVVDVPLRAILFGSPTCRPCVTLREVLTEVEADRGDFTWRYVDAADHLDVSRELKILRVPTLIVFDGDGRIAARTSGVPAPEDLHRALDGEITDLAA